MYILLALATAVLIAGIVFYIRVENKNEAARPLALKAHHGGGSIVNVDWLRLRKEYYAALVESDNTAGTEAYYNYAFMDTPDANTRSHYERYGHLYPVHIFPRVKQ